MMTGELQIKVAQAVHVLNHDSLSCNRVAANQWLVQFQHSDAAWEVSTALLTSSPLVFDVQFFAAQILRRKIQHEGYCLQLPAKEALLNALLLAAKRFSLGPPQLLTQICLALSALVLRVSEHKQPIEQLFVSLHKLQSQENGNIAVLEMLTVLPEEVAEDHNGDRNIDAANRSQYTRELLARTSTVLEFLLLQSENKFHEGIQLHERNRKILRCLLSWGLPQVLLYRVQYLKEILLQPAITNRDEKVIGGLACLMSEMGQAAPALVAKASTEALALADALLSCVAFPSVDWEISDSTLQFWCGLASFLLGMDLDMTSNRKVVEEMFIPIFSALLDALLLRAQADNSELDSLTGRFDMPDGLVQFRMNSEELLVDICRLLGSAAFVQKLFCGGWASSDSLVSWVEVETRMFALNMMQKWQNQTRSPWI